MQQSRRAFLSDADVVDVFVYVVVLNLAVQYIPAVISETFTMSLLTAVVLKAVLELVVALKEKVKGRFHAASTTSGRVGAALLLWALLIGSKFIVLELISIIFRGSVNLGGFVPVTLLIIALLLARSGVRRLLSPALHSDAHTRDEQAEQQQ